MKYSNKSVSFDGSGYVVEIITATGASLGGKDTKVKLLPSGLMLKYAGEEDIYKPVRYSELSISAMMDGYNFDLYQPDLTSVTVNLYKQKNPKSNYKNLIWTGHLTPCVYSQPAYESKFEIEFVAVDCLSTLDGLTYEQDNKDIRSFDYIIKKCLNTADYYWWSDDCLNTESVPWLKLDEYFISEQNFYSSEGEPKTCKEVLESILSYLNVTMIQEGHTFKIIDFDIQAGLTNNYSRSKDTANVFSGGNLSLSEVYSDIQITSNTYEIGNYLPDLDDDDTLVTTKEKKTTSGYPQQYKEDDTKYDYTYVYQFLKHPTIKAYSFYPPNGTKSLNDRTLSPYYHQTLFMRQIAYDVLNGRPRGDNWDYFMAFRNVVFDGSLTPVDFVKIPDDSGSISYLKAGRKYYRDMSYGNEPIITYTSGEKIAVGKCCLIFNMSVFFGTENCPYPYSEAKESRKINHKDTDRSPYVEVMLKIGKNYLSGDTLNTSSLTWTTTESWCKFRIGDNSERYFNNWLNLMDKDSSTEYNIDTDGYVIDITDKVLDGTIDVKVRPPYVHPDETFYNVSQMPFWTFIKDLKLTVAKPIKHQDTNGMTLKEIDEPEDIVWETVIDMSYAAGTMEQDLDITTVNDRICSFSDVLKPNVVDSTTGGDFNAVLLDGYKFLETVDKGLGSFPMEQYKLNSYYEHYSKPRKVLDITLDDVFKVGERVIIDGEHYIVNSSEIDILNDMSSVQLIQHDFLL